MDQLLQNQKSETGAQYADERYYEYMLRRNREEDAKLKKGKSMIWVTFAKEGIHKYPVALEDPKLATGDEYDVSFLG